MVTLELSNDEAEILRTELGHRIADLDRELAGTSKRDLQHGLAVVLECLQGLHRKLTTLVR